MTYRELLKFWNEAFKEKGRLEPVKCKKRRWITGAWVLLVFWGAEPYIPWIEKLASRDARLCVIFSSMLAFLPPIAAAFIFASSSYLAKRKVSKNSSESPYSKYFKELLEAAYFYSMDVFHQ